MSDPARPDLVMPQDEYEMVRWLFEMTGGPAFPANAATACRIAARMNAGGNGEVFRRLAEAIDGARQQEAASPVAAKPCGCGPLEPCKPHLGTGDLRDWEGRARAAEAKLGALEALCRRRAAEIRADYPGVEMSAVPVSAASILAITGSEERGHVVDSSDHAERAAPGLSALDAAMEATSGGEEWGASWEAAAEGNRYRRALILSAALQAASPAIVNEAKLAAVRGYRLMLDDDGDIHLYGPCAETIGCLFGREWDGFNGVTLGDLIDAATGHEGVQGERAHARLTEINGETFSATCTGPDCGEQFTDSETGEYEFTSRDRMVKLLRADGWQADPVLCPTCQPGGAA